MNIRDLKIQIEELARKYATLRLADKDNVVELTAQVQGHLQKQDARVLAHRDDARVRLKAEMARWRAFETQAAADIAALKVVTEELAVAARLPRVTLWQRIRARWRRVVKMLS